MWQKKKKKLGEKSRIFMHFDASLLFLFENRTRREEWRWIENLNGMMRRMEKQISPSFQSGILMGFVCVTRHRQCLTGLKEICRGQATDMSVEWEPQDSGPMWYGSGMSKPIRTILFSFSFPIFMFIQLHSKDFPHELAGGWQWWFPRCKHAYTASFFFFF